MLEHKGLVVVARRRTYRDDIARCHRLDQSRALGVNRRGIFDRAELAAMASTAMPILDAAARACLTAPRQTG
jgi:hypothetical protein